MSWQLLKRSFSPSAFSNLAPWDCARNIDRIMCLLPACSGEPQFSCSLSRPYLHGGGSSSNVPSLVASRTRGSCGSLETEQKPKTRACVWVSPPPLEDRLGGQAPALGTVEAKQQNGAFQG